MLDDRTITRSDVDVGPHRVWSVPSNTFAWRAYVGERAGGDGVDVRAVPARCRDVGGLPPTWIGVGTADLFHDEDVAFAARLREAGVPCAVEVVDGGFHAFDVVAPRAAVSRAFRAAWTRALSDMLAAR
jgi:acetyl esterase/lipase